jgi:transposase-like protein
VSKKKTYTPVPEVPEAIREKFLTVMAVQSGAMTVTDGAAKLGMSRNQFQTMMHKAMAGMIEAMTPKPPGRKPVPEEQAKLRAESEKLKRENDKLKTQVGSTHQMLELVAGIFNRRIDRAMSARESKPKAKKTSPNDDTEDDLQALVELRQSHRVCMLIAAALVGVSTSTVRRWRARKRAGLPLRCTRHGQRRTRPTADIVAVVASHVRDTHGLIGAAALRTCAPGVSRRQAADIKRTTVTAMERERIADTTRVHVNQPGVVRGMDGMHVMTTHGVYWVLLFGDASVAYRTSTLVTSTYDSDAVARAIDEDFRRNGAPLVLRMDRASAQRTPAVNDVLAHHRVLVLHGPPRLPRFYGQQERQNRDHRAWLDVLGTPSPAALPAHTERMRYALNERWPQRRLGWRTPAQAWSSRANVETVRAAFHGEVLQYKSKYRRRSVDDDMAQRLAIEKALTRNGWLRREAGGWC